MAQGMGHKTYTLSLLGNTGDGIFLSPNTQTNAARMVVRGSYRVVGIDAICFNETNGVTSCTVDVLNGTTTLLASTITVVGALQAGLGAVQAGTLTATDANRILTDGDTINCTVVVGADGDSVQGIVVYLHVSEI